MAVTKPPAFQFYAKDFLTGTMTLSLSERGAYVTLLAYQWDNGSVPGDDLELLSRAMQCQRADAELVWPKVQTKFKRVTEGIWRNLRLEKERTKQRKFRKSQSNKGKKGGRPKSRGFSPVKAEHKAQESLSSSSSSSTAEILDRTVVPISDPSVPPSPSWPGILDFLRARISLPTFEVWFGPITTARETDTVLELFVPSALHAEWLTKHYTLILAEAIEAICPGKRWIAKVAAERRAG